MLIFYHQNMEAQMRDYQLTVWRNPKDKVISCYGLVSYARWCAIEMLRIPHTRLVHNHNNKIALIRKFTDDEVLERTDILKYCSSSKVYPRFERRIRF